MFDYPRGAADFNERIRQMFEEARALTQLSSVNGPSVWGFNMKFTRDCQPIVKEFGNVSPYGISGFIEPPTDVIERLDSVSVIIELPGVGKDEIDLKASVEGLLVTVNTPFRKFSKDVRLSCRVRPESTSARYNNGVLEVTLKRAEDAAAAGRKVKIL